MSIESQIEELRPTDLSPAKTPSEYVSSILAFVLLVVADFLMKSCGFKRFHGLIRGFPKLGQLNQDRKVIARICTAVDRAAAHYFKRAWCLQRSATTTCLLRLWGVDAKLTIGVKKIPFHAHAWVEVDEQVVNDHPLVKNQYTVLERC